jgi:outer membrane protein assembly factor BamA
LLVKPQLAACVRSLLASLLFAIPACAQTGKVGQVRVSGSKLYPEAQVVAYCGLKAGDEVTREAIQAAADRLAQLGLFANVRYKFSTTMAVNIEFVVEDAETLPVMFDNFAIFDDVELIAAIRTAVPWFEGRAPQDGSILEVMTEALREFLAAHKVEQPLERGVLAGPGEEGMIQQFRLAGASLQMESIAFVHPLAAASSRVRIAIGDILNKPFSRFAIAVFANEQVRPLFLTQGYLEVKFGTPQVRFTGDPNKPLPDKVGVEVPVHAGPQYRFAGAVWAGNLSVDSKSLEALLGLAPGDIADGMRLLGAWEKVRMEYGRSGFLDAQVTPAPEFAPEQAQVRFRVRIEEGPQYRMGKLVISGLSLTAERMLTTAWKLPAGAIFDRKYFEDFLENQARKKQAFGEYVVNFTSVGHFLQTNPGTRTVDVLIDFQSD